MGTWSLHESSLHINCSELHAATYAIKAFTKSLNNAHVLIQTDNTSAIAYLNKMRELNRVCQTNMPVPSGNGVSARKSPFKQSTFKVD